MREILFRGKRKDDGEWVEGLLCYNTYNELCIQPIDDFPCCVVIPESISQFVGLTDKNGKKIFEGDIVEVTYLTRCYDNETEIREVTYNEEECCYYPMRWNETCEVCDYFTEIQSIEVIGNIHDNPELLKGGGEG